jgi:ubiquitin carboxyl-terminal hydrolase 10
VVRVVQATTFKKKFFTNFFFNLSLVLYHHGFSASGGHYTLDVLHPNRYPGSVNAKSREGWVRIDDELVSDVRHDNVFEAYERDDARCAYLLFYRRML